MNYTVKYHYSQCEDTKKGRTDNRSAFDKWPFIM